MPTVLLYLGEIVMPNDSKSTTLKTIKIHCVLLYKQWDDNVLMIITIILYPKNS